MLFMGINYVAGSAPFFGWIYVAHVWWIWLTVSESDLSFLNVAGDVIYYFGMHKISDNLLDICTFENKVI
jgi:hypothetical protein